MRKRYTIQFNTKMGMEAYPSVKTDTLVLSDEIRKGLNAHETYTYQIFDGNKEVEWGGWHGDDSKFGRSVPA